MYMCIHKLLRSIVINCTAVSHSVLHYTLPIYFLFHYSCEFSLMAAVHHARNFVSPVSNYTNCLSARFIRRFVIICIIFVLFVFFYHDLYILTFTFKIYLYFFLFLYFLFFSSTPSCLLH